MKWILLALLVLNLSLGGFQFWQARQPEEVIIKGQKATHSNLQLTANQTTRLEASGTKEDQPKESKPVNKQCVRVMGLVEGDSMDVVISRLTALEVSTSKENLKQITKTDYQLLLGPFDSAELARSELNGLKSKDVESYVITTGDNINSLSLGVFSSEGNAGRRQADLKDQGILAKVFKKEHFKEEGVLKIEKESAAMITDETLSSMLASFEGVDFLRYDCN